MGLIYVRIRGSFYTWFFGLRMWLQGLFQAITNEPRLCIFFYTNAIAHDFFFFFESTNSGIGGSGFWSIFTIEIFALTNSRMAVNT